MPLDGRVEVQHEVAVCFKDRPKTGEVLCVFIQEGAEFLEGGSLQSLGIEVGGVYFGLQHKVQNSFVAEGVHQEAIVCLKELCNAIDFSQLLEAISFSFQF